MQTTQSDYDEALSSPSSSSSESAEEEEINPFEALNFPPKRFFGTGEQSRALRALEDFEYLTEEEQTAKKKERKKRKKEEDVLLEQVKNGRVVVLADEIVGKKLFNFRDLSEATHTGRSQRLMGTGKIFRSACVSRGDVNREDVLRTIAFLKDTVGIKTIIDLRNKDEKESDPFDDLVEEFYPTVKEKVIALLPQMRLQDNQTLHLK